MPVPIPAQPRPAPAALRGPVLFAAFGADGPPDYIHLVPAGTFRGIDGRGPFRLLDAAAVIAASTLPAPIDETHATDLAAPNGAPAPARGWIVALEARADGIWGQVEWTDAGRALVADRAYRGISPAMDVVRKDGTVRRILRASLTNTPNLAQLTTLHAEGDTVDLLTRLRALLGLDNDADDAAVITALEQVMGDRTMQGQALGAVRAALNVGADAGAAVILAAVQSQRGQPAAAAALQAEVTTLQSQLAEVRTEAARARAAAVVDDAIRAGKPVRAMRDHYIARHAQEPAAVESELAALPSLHSGGMPAPGERPDADGLTSADRQVIQLMGLDPKDYATTLAARGVKTEA